MKWTVQEACGFDDDEIDSTCSWFDEKLNQVWKWTDKFGLHPDEE
jgi:hypothetical protein